MTRRHANRNNYNRPNTVTSKCQGVTVRGTAQQISQKYTSLAAESDDPFIAEDFRQHAEHYNRLVSAPC